MNDHLLHQNTCTSVLNEEHHCDCVYGAVRRISNEPLPPNAQDKIRAIVARKRTTDNIGDYLQQRSETSVAGTDGLLLVVDILAAISNVGIQPEAVLELIIRIYPHHAEEILDRLLNQQ